MRRTTRLPRYHVEKVFPFLAGRARRAIRLHPARAADLPPNASKIGGAFVWPPGEPAPVCPQTGCRAVPVLQILSSDFPSVEFPAGADVLQVLWYPRSYEECLGQPKILLVWRDASALSSPSVLAPVYENHDRNFMVHECEVPPEEVLEYPCLFALPPEQRDEIRRWEDEVESGNGLEAAYQSCHSMCPGTKIGGYASGTGQGLSAVVNAHGHRLQYFLTLSDHEWDEGSAPRWSPVEEDRPPDEEDEEGPVAEPWDHRRWCKYLAAREPLGIRLKCPLNLYLNKSATPWTWTTGFQRRVEASPSH